MTGNGLAARGRGRSAGRGHAVSKVRESRAVLIIPPVLVVAVTDRVSVMC